MPHKYNERMMFLSGLLMAGFVSFFYFSYIESHPSTEKRKSYSEQLCSEQKKQYALPKRPPVLHKEQAIASDHNASQQPKQNTEEPNWCDLAAQETMADYTRGIERATWIMTFLTGLAVFFVFRTLIYTRNTLAQTKEATVAAQSTVAETRRVGEAQTRAYLGIDRYLPYFRNGSTSGIDTLIKIRLKNSGNSPAMLLGYRTEVAITGSSHKGFTNSKLFEREINPATGFTIEIPFIFQPETIRDSCAVTVTIRYRYRDIYDREEWRSVAYKSYVTQIDLPVSVDTNVDSMSHNSSCLGFVDDNKDWADPDNYQP